MVFKYLPKNLKMKFFMDNDGSSQGTIGYLVVTEKNASSLPDLAPGLVFDNKSDAPPWIIVDRNLRTTIVSNWPIELWKVQALKPIKPQGHRGNYIRCRAIKVLERLPAYKVFGEVDTGLGDVLEFAGKMTLDQALALSILRAENAHEIHSLASHRWLNHNPTVPDGYIKDYDGVLSLDGSMGKSPIGNGLMLISNTLFDQAGRADPENAYAHKDDGTPYLTATWSEARSVLSDAALSFGASELFDQAGLVEMRRPLRQVSPSLVSRIEGKIG